MCLLTYAILDLKLAWAGFVKNILLPSEYSEIVHWEIMSSLKISVSYF